MWLLAALKNSLLHCALLALSVMENRVLYNNLRMKREPLEVFKGKDLVQRLIKKLFTSNVLWEREIVGLRFKISNTSKCHKSELWHNTLHSTDDIESV